MNDNGLIATVRLKVEHDTTGRIYLSSDDLPGFWLWGIDPEYVFSLIPLTIRDLHRDNQGFDVEVRKAQPPKAERWAGTEIECAQYEVYKVTGAAETTLHG